MKKKQFRQDMEINLKQFLDDDTPWRSIKGSTKDFANIIIDNCEEFELENEAYKYIEENKDNLDLMKLAACIWPLLPQIEVVDDDQLDEDYDLE